MSRYAGVPEALAMSSGLGPGPLAGKGACVTPAISAAVANDPSMVLCVLMMHLLGPDARNPGISPRRCAHRSATAGVGAVTESARWGPEGSVGDSRKLGDEHALLLVGQAAQGAAQSGDPVRRVPRDPRAARRRSARAW